MEAEQKTQPTVSLPDGLLEKTVYLLGRGRKKSDAERINNLLVYASCCKALSAMGGLIDIDGLASAAAADYLMNEATKNCNDAKRILGMKPFEQPNIY